jgi:hypothetical protein
MFTEEERAFLARVTRTMQIIVGALAGGVVMFFVAVLVITSDNPPKPPDTPILSYMAVAAALAAILVATLFPGLVLRSQRQAILNGKPALEAGPKGGQPLSEAEQQLMPFLGGYQTALIIRSAILEGAAFFCLIAYMQEGQLWSLVCAGVLLLFVLAGMPTRSRVEDAVERERRAIEELRQMQMIDAR